MVWMGRDGGFLYAFREQEDLFDMCEAVGARMHTGLLSAWWRLSRFAREAVPQYQSEQSAECPKQCAYECKTKVHYSDFIEDFTQRFPAYVDEYETLLTDNRDLETAF